VLSPGRLRTTEARGGTLRGAYSPEPFRTVNLRIVQEIRPNE
jgi:hypothetical protein